MALPGKKPKPMDVRLIEGTKGVATKNLSPPIATTGDLETPPDWFTKTQLEEWEYIIYHAPKGLLKKADKSVLITFVIANDLHRQACEYVAQNGMIIKAPITGVPMQNPYMAVINRQAGIMQKAASELGFSPTSRARVSVDKSVESENPFLNRGKRNDSK